MTARPPRGLFSASTHVYGDKTTDLYRTCEKNCGHDCYKGVLIEELLGPEDGPHGGSLPYTRRPSPVILDGRIQLQPESE